MDACGAIHIYWWMEFPTKSSFLSCDYVACIQKSFSSSLFGIKSRRHCNGNKWGCGDGGMGLHTASHSQRESWSLFKYETAAISVLLLHSLLSSCTVQITNCHVSLYNRLNAIHLAVFHTCDLAWTWLEVIGEYGVMGSSVCQRGRVFL